MFVCFVVDTLSSDFGLIGGWFCYKVGCRFRKWTVSVAVCGGGLFVWSVGGTVGWFVGWSSVSESVVVVCR